MRKKFWAVLLLAVALMFTTQPGFTVPGGQGGPKVPQCNDGIDNDGDGYIDWFHTDGSGADDHDPDCHSIHQMFESPQGEKPICPRECDF